MEPDKIEENGQAIPLDDLIEQSKRLREQSTRLVHKIDALNEQIDRIRNNDRQLDRSAKKAPIIKIDDSDEFAYESPE